VNIATDLRSELDGLLSNRKLVVVCATQRSGSTLLIEDLRNNGLGRGEEHFLPLIQNADAHSDLIFRLIENATDANQVATIKVMANYMPAVDAYLSRNRFSAAEDGVYAAVADVFADAFWIYLRRRSVVHQAVSRLMAAKTGVSHAIASDRADFIPGQAKVGGQADYNSTVEVGDVEIREGVLDICLENAAWERFFAENNIEPLRLVHESTATDLSYINAIREGLGFPTGEIRSERNLLKLSNRKSDEIIEAFVDAEQERISEKILGKRTGQGRSEPLFGEALQATGRGKTGVDPVAGIDTPSGLWANYVEPFLGDVGPLESMTVVQLGCTNGYFTAKLLESAQEVRVVDTSPEKLKPLIRSFAGVENVRFEAVGQWHLGDIADESVDFIFSFDSLVHADLDHIRSILGDVYRMLKHGGYGLVHHSNLDRNTGLDYRRAPHARNFMTQALFAHLAIREGLTVVKSRVIGWGSGKHRIRDLDCITLVRKPER